MNKITEKRKNGQYENLTRDCGYNPAKLICKFKLLQKDYRINLLHKNKVKADVSSETL